jgi:uncharacterized protein
MVRKSLAALAILACWMGLAFAGPATQVPDSVRAALASNFTVGLVAGGAGSTDAIIASDIAQALDESDKLRVLPILGRGSIQSIADVIYLKGADIAIVHSDVLAETMRAGSIPRESNVQYIAKLFSEEVHILARKEILALNDLNGKPVATGPVGSGIALSAGMLFDMAQVRPNIIYESQSAALHHLRHGDIAAVILVGGKPIPELKGLEGGVLHFLPIPLNAQLVDAYLPTSLDHQSYPDLIPDGPPVDTVAVSSLLVTLMTPSDSPRGKRVNRFVDAFFSRFDQFQRPGFHPKWREVSLAAQVQGWGRYPEASSQLRISGAPTTRLPQDSYLHRPGQSLESMDSDRRQSLYQQHSGP